MDKYAEAAAEPSRHIAPLWMFLGAIGGILASGGLGGLRFCWVLLMVYLAALSLYFCVRRGMHVCRKLSAKRRQDAGIRGWDNIFIRLSLMTPTQRDAYERDLSRHADEWEARDLLSRVEQCRALLEARSARSTDEIIAHWTGW